jgi:VWFA-related protein
MRLTTVLLAASLLLGQQPTFKSSTQLVEIDAVILDKAGNFVTGLKPDQITLLENGKPQQIQQFFMVAHDSASDPSSVTTQDAGQAQNGAHRVFIILFDEGHLAKDSLMRVKQGAEQFVRDMFHEGDAGGIFSNNGMYHGHLTTSKTDLLAGIHASQPAFDNRQGILASFREWPRVDSEVDAARIAEGAREVSTALAQKACLDDPVACRTEGGQGPVENLIEQKARLYVRQARMLTDQTIQNLDKISNGLAKIPGRKTVVLLSEGFFIQDMRTTLQLVAAHAARNGITIYSVDGRGLINGLSANPDVVSMAAARSQAFDTGEDGPTILTQGTGGFAVRNIDDMSRAFGLIVRDTSTYYVIGYQPENAKMDGKIRKIEIRTAVEGAHVRARTSYAATALPPQVAIWGFGK